MTSAVPGDVEVVLLDQAGVIVAVNEVWRAFAAANGGDPRRTGTGASYLRVCETAADPDSLVVAGALRSALAGELAAPVRLLTACHGAGVRRWFEMLVTSRFDDDGAGVGAMVTLRPVRAGFPDPDHGGVRASRAGLPTLDESAAWGLVESAPDGLMLTTPDGRIVYVNQRLEFLSGHDRADLLGQSVEVLVPEPHRNQHRRLRARYAAHPSVRRMGTSATPPLSLRRCDGTDLDVEISLAPVDVTGHPLVAASVRDVTEQRAADRSRRRLLELLDLVPDAVFVLDNALRIRWVNATAVDVLGYQRATMTRLTLADLDPALDPTSASAVAAALLAETSTGPAVRNCELRHRDGTCTPWEVHIRATEEEPGEGPLFIVVARDVRERQAQHARLLRSEESFRTAFTNAPIGMAVARIDNDGNRRIVSANEALGRIVGVPADELPGRDFAEFTDAEGEPAARRRVGRIVADGESASSGRRRAYRRPDGTRVWIEVHAATFALADSDGRTLLVQVVDVTDQAEADLLRSRHAALTTLVAAAATDVLSGATDERAYARITAGAARIFGAHAAVFMLDADGSGELEPAATWEDPQRGAPLPLPLPRDVTERLLATPQRTVSIAGPASALAGLQPGPAVLTDCSTGTAPTGMLALAREPGAAPFSATEIELLASLGRQIGLTVQLIHARADQQRLALLEERQRIARDLHDTVVQDLIAVGMRLDNGLPPQADSRQRTRELELIEQLDAAVKRLRESVFELRQPIVPPPLGEQVRNIAAQAHDLLGHNPHVVLCGPLERTSPEITHQLVAVLHEALSNVVRHANASSSIITCAAADGRIVLDVEDNGRGVPADVTLGDGLRNLRSRAQNLGGWFLVQPRPAGGTVLTWSVPDPAVPCEPSER